LMQGIYYRTPETNHASRVYSDADIFWLQFRCM
jgi:hypothetical protein